MGKKLSHVCEAPLEVRSFNWYYEYRQIVFKLVAQALLDDHAQGPLPDGVRLYLVKTVDACFFSDDLACGVRSKKIGRPKTVIAFQWCFGQQQELF